MNESRRRIWRDRAREVLESRVPVRTWCEERGIHYAMMYRWLRVFRDEEPDVFGGYDMAHAGDGHRNWLECVRRARNGEPIEPVVDDRDYAPVEFSSIELAASVETATPAIMEIADACAPIMIKAGAVCVLIGNDARAELVAATVRGACAR